MSEIRELTRDELEQAVDISVKAFAGGGRFSPAARLAEKERLIDQVEQEEMTLWGLLRDEKLLGVMKLYDYTMNFGGAPIPLGGVGGVAVNLLHKKEKVARDLIDHYLRHYLSRETYWAALYPFRPDFYRRMGFGWGSKSNVYEIQPVGFPGRGDKSRLRVLEEADAPAVAACYNRAFQRTHGLFARRADGFHFARLFEKPEIHLVGAFDREELTGYLAYSFEKVEGGSFLSNDIDVVECLYDAPAALHGMLTFLRSQLDQIRRIRWSTQDDHFHYLLIDPRNGSDKLLRIISHPTNEQGIGLMYRVLNVAGAFRQLADYNFNQQSLRLAIVIHDSFLRENTGRSVVHFTTGRAAVQAPDAPADATIEMDIGDFSSLLMGCVPFSALQRYGLAAIDDPAAVETVDRLFRQAHKPICVTGF
jgi:predicted acetyltransferase